MEFQKIAHEVGFVTWDKLFNKLHSPWGTVNWERNYMNKYVEELRSEPNFREILDNLYKYHT